MREAPKVGGRSESYSCSSITPDFCSQTSVPSILNAQIKSWDTHNKAMPSQNLFNVNSKYRNMCFTWNNAPEDGWAQLTDRLPACNYLVAGREVGEQGTPHIQGYAEFASPAKGSTLKNKFPTIHWEKRMGSAEQAAVYCKKDGDYQEEGELSNQGKRSDLDEVRALMASPDTANMGTVIMQARSMQAVKFSEVYLTYHERKRNFKPNVIWIFGGAGLGKSRLADAQARLAVGDSVHTQTKSIKWWNGYDAHKAVIVDDIRKDFCTFTDMLHLIDRYPYKVEIKGGMRQMLATHMYITGPVHPEKVWNTDEDLHQLVRRIDVIAEILSETELVYHKGDALPSSNESTEEDDQADDVTETESIASCETVRS